MAQASEYQEALAKVTAFTMSARQLVLFAGNDIVLTYIADVQTLAGTAWNVVNYNAGRGIVTLIPGSSSTMNFGTDGQVTGRAGCNSYFASYRWKGNGLTIDQPGATSMLCDEPKGVMDQEARFLAALHSAATFRINGNMLEIQNAGGQIAIVANRAP